MKALIRFILFTGLLFFLSQCFGVSKTFPEKRFYLIEPGETKQLFPAAKPRTFIVRKVFISQKFEGKEFVYRKENAVYESDFYIV